MSKIYVGANSKARKAKKIYVGVNGTARMCKKIYVGVNNKARLAFCCLPTNVKMIGGYGQAGYFTYDDSSYNKQSFETERNFGNIYLRKPSETIRVYYDGGYYDQEVTGGDNNVTLYAMPKWAKYWYGANGQGFFSYSAYNASTEEGTNAIWIYGNSVYSDDYSYIYFNSPSASDARYLNVRISMFADRANPGTNLFYLVAGTDLSAQMALYDGMGNVTYRVYVGSNQRCYVGYRVDLQSDSGRGDLGIGAIWFD